MFWYLKKLKFWDKCKLRPCSQFYLIFVTLYWLISLIWNENPNPQVPTRRRSNGLERFRRTGTEYQPGNPRKQNLCPSPTIQVQFMDISRNLHFIPPLHHPIPPPHSSSNYTPPPIYHCNEKREGNWVMNGGKWVMNGKVNVKNSTLFPFFL